MKRIFLLLAFTILTAAPAHAAILVFSGTGSSSVYVTKLTLEAARTAAEVVHKTVVVTSALTQAQSNILGPWPVDRALEFKKGGSIANSSAFVVNGSFKSSPGCLAGTGMVTFGSGSVTEVSPEWWGTDGVDDTYAVQSAISAFPRVLFGLKTYQVTHVELKDGSALYGSGWGTVLHQKSGTKPRKPQADGMITANYADSETPVKNISVRDMTLSMDSVAKGYTLADETSHLICTGNVENLIISNVQFTGWRGDAILLGGRFGGMAMPKLAARNTSITKCRFDGVNYANRQCISGYSVDGLTVDSCSFTRSTRANMPGAIDFEPEEATWYIRDITISNCTFEDIGTPGARKPPLIVVGGAIASPYRDRFARVAFVNNRCSNTNGLWLSRSADVAPAKDIGQGFRVVGNNFSNIQGDFSFFNVNGLVLSQNTFYNNPGALRFGYKDGAVCRRVKVDNNIFNVCGTLDSAIYIFNAHDLALTNNTFTDCGVRTGVSYAIQVLPGVSSSIRINNNLFNTPHGITKIAVIVAAHKMDDKSQFLGNILQDGISGPQGGKWRMH